MLSFIIAYSLESYIDHTLIPPSHLLLDSTQINPIFVPWY